MPLPIDRHVAETLSEGQKRGLAHSLVEFLRGQWFGPAYPAETGGPLLLLLMAVYRASLQGVLLTKREACDLMRVERATTGPRYIKMAVDAGFINVERRVHVDGRMLFLAATPRLVSYVETGFASMIRQMPQAPLIARAAPRKRPPASEGTTHTPADADMRLAQERFMRPPK